MFTYPKISKKSVARLICLASVICFLGWKYIVQPSEDISKEAEVVENFEQKLPYNHRPQLDLVYQGRSEKERLKTDENIESPPKLLKGDLNLSDEAILYFKIGDEDIVRIKNIIVDARDEIVDAALSVMAEIKEWDEYIDIKLLMEMSDIDDSQKNDFSVLADMVVGCYEIAPFPEMGTEIESNMRENLASIIDEVGAVSIVNEAKRHREFLNFGKDKVILVVSKSTKGDGFSVYFEFRDAESDSFKGGGRLPYAAFNKRFSNIFHIE